jgi:hypothetical protein
VSGVLDEATTEPTAEPAAGTRAPALGLARAELHRFRSRRFIQVLLGLSVLGWLAALTIGLLNFGVPDDDDFAAARAQIDQIVAEQQAFYEQCQDDPTRPEDVPVDMYCGPPLTADDLRVEDFLPVHPFSFADQAQNGALGFAAAAAVLCFLVGATWIGGEWSSRSIVALLFWEPRRTRVMGTKLGVLVLAAAVIGAAAQAAWLAMAGILSAAAGDGGSLPTGFWGDLLATQGRGVLLAALIGALGFGLTNLVHNTGAALGIAFVYFAIVETALRVMAPATQPWLLSNNAAGLVQDGGLRLIIFDPSGMSPTGELGYREYLLTNLQSGIFLAVVAGVIAAVGMVLFARRDVH